MKEPKCILCNQTNIIHILLTNIDGNREIRQEAEAKVCQGEWQMFTFILCPLSFVLCPPIVMAKLQGSVKQPLIIKSKDL